MQAPHSTTNHLGKLKLLSAVAIASTLIACTGGGGSSSSTTTTNSSVTSVTPSSVAPASSSIAPASSSIAAVSSSSVAPASSSTAVTSSSTGIDLGSEPVVTPDDNEETSGTIIYQPVPEGQTQDSVPAPVLVTSDGTTYTLPYVKAFDYGTGNSFILDDFADNDHQNNLGGAVATFKGENYTEGGGYWYVFNDKTGSKITNTTGLAINPYNVGEAIANHKLTLEMDVKADGFAGVGSNILFEEYGADLSDLTQVKITVSGSGSIAAMFETTDIDKPKEWGNYAAPLITLSSAPTTITYNVADFVGEEYSGLEGLPLKPHLNVAAKFFFQTKTAGKMTFNIHKIEFFFSGSPSNTPLRIAKFDWKNDDYNPDFVFDLSTVGIPEALDTTKPYMDWSTVKPLPATTVQAAEVSPSLVNTGKANWLHREGTKLFDSQGNAVRLTGVNWFGFETKNSIPFGLWTRSYKSMLDQIKATGFNTVRIPFSDYIIDASKAKTALLGDMDIDLTLNGVTATQTPLDLLDLIITYSQQIGLKVVLDNHSRGPDKYLVEGHWVTPEYPESKWISNWVWMAQRYKDNDAVVALDLNNEPHFEAAWDSTNTANNWNSAAERCANAIQAVNPNALIIIEGVEALADDVPAVNRYWWGGNFQGAKTAPLAITYMNKLVYSPHEYGPEVYVQPWFRDYRFPGNLPYIWEDRFGFIYSEGIGHLFVGEFGIKNNVPGSAANKWFGDFVNYMKARKEGYSWTYWAWNPNSGDTGGILQNNWKDTHQWKLDALKDIQAPLIGNMNGK